MTIEERYAEIETARAAGAEHETEIRRLRREQAVILEDGFAAIDRMMEERRNA